MNCNILIILGILCAAMAAAGCTEPPPKKEPHLNLTLPKSSSGEEKTEKTFLKSVRNGDVDKACESARKIFKPGRSKSKIKDVLAKADLVCHDNTVNADYYYYWIKTDDPKTNISIEVDINTATNTVITWKLLDKIPEMK